MAAFTGTLSWLISESWLGCSGHFGWTCSPRCCRTSH